jgi:hypothetical protein
VVAAVDGILGRLGSRVYALHLANYSDDREFLPEAL